MKSLVLVALALTLCGCEMTQRISEGSLRNATATGAKTELDRLGYQVKGDLTCRLPPGNTLSVVRVGCVGRTTHGEQVRVTGIAYDANTRHPRQDFVITVGGLMVLRRPCLGLGCTDSP